MYSNEIKKIIQGDLNNKNNNNNNNSNKNEQNDQKRDNDKGCCILF